MWIIFLVIAIILFIYIDNNILIKEEYNLYSKVPKEIKIIHLSDLHGKSFGKNNSRLLKKIGKENPDLIFFTGDLITAGQKDIKKTTDFLCELSKSCPVFFVSGNHEFRKNQKEEVESLLKDGDVIVLNNNIEKINIKETSINILGLSYMQGDFKDYVDMIKKEFCYPDLSEYIKPLENCDGLKIILSHYPENFSLAGEKSLDKFDFDYYFAGHAHGGQFRFPFIKGIYAAGQGLFPKYTKGVYGKGPKMILTSGLGTGTIPIRIFNAPRIFLIKIR
ncbi:MAG: metallophosphoesterase [Clostridia bacterium]|nr:metallophosphoesterase [Clostridia bacterium]